MYLRFSNQLASGWAGKIAKQAAAWKRQTQFCCGKSSSAASAASASSSSNRLNASVLNEMSSDDSTRKGFQPFNFNESEEAKRPEEGFNWTFENEEVGMIRPDFYRPQSVPNHLIKLDECIVDCEKFSTGKSQGLEAMFHRNEDGAIEIDTNNHVTENLTAWMQNTYQKWGVVLLRNTNLLESNGLGDAVKMASVAKLLFKDEPEPYTAGSNLRGQVDGETNVYDTGAPRSAHLHYHHEMQYVNRSPKNVAFMALAVPNNNKTGPTYVSYNPGVTKDLLDTECGEKLATKGVCYVRKMPDLEHFRKGENLDPRIVYNFWQTSMNTDDKTIAAKIAEDAGLEVEWEDSPIFGRYMVTRFYIDAFEYDPDFEKKNQLFFSVADDWMWFDTWPGLANVAPQHRPLAIEYGDGSAFTHAEKQLLCDVYDDHGFPVSWDRPGDMALICNRRTAHGRPEYDIDEEGGEQRELGVMLGARFTRQGQRANAW